MFSHKRNRSHSTFAQSREFYHVTLEKNLPSIIESGLDPCYGGSQLGISSLRGGTFRVHSQSKVHFTFDWSTAKRYADHYFTLLEKNDDLDVGNFPVVLKLNLSANHFVISPDPDDHPTGCYTTQIVAAKLISILTSNYPTLSPEEISYISGQNYNWLPIQKWDNKSFLPTYIESLSLKRQRSADSGVQDNLKNSAVNHSHFPKVSWSTGLESEQPRSIVEDSKILGSPLKKQKM